MLITREIISFVHSTSRCAQLASNGHNPLTNSAMHKKNEPFGSFISSNAFPINSCELLCLRSNRAYYL